jgi:hypothetical protein
VGDPPRWPRDTSLSTKVGTQFRQQVAVAVAKEFVFVFVFVCISA